MKPFCAFIAMVALGFAGGQASLRKQCPRVGTSRI